MRSIPRACLLLAVLLNAGALRAQVRQVRVAIPGAGRSGAAHPIQNQAAPGLGPGLSAGLSLTPGLASPLPLLPAALPAAQPRSLGASAPTEGSSRIGAVQAEAATPAAGAASPAEAKTADDGAPAPATLGARLEEFAAQGESLFDGSYARRPAAPSEAEIVSLYKAARPDARAIDALKDFGSFPDAAEEIVKTLIFIGNKESLNRRAPASVRQAVAELLDVSEARDPASRRFLAALGAYSGHDIVDRYEKAEAMRQPGLRALGGAPETRRRMPRNPLKSGEYWDMASGPNAVGHILEELEAGTRYLFFDLSPFVASLIDTVAARRGANAAAVEGDILRLRAPERPLAVLRSKNAVAYVPGFAKRLEEMAEWIAPAGRLVIQNDPNPGQRMLILEQHAALALRLLEAGWDFSFEFAALKMSEHALDTIIFTRPRGEAAPRSGEEARRLWDGYAQGVEYADKLALAAAVLFGG